MGWNQPPLEPPLLDVRPEPQFLARHEATAVGIPLEELPLRIHELPPTGNPLRVTDADPHRVRRAADWLEARGYLVSMAPFDPRRLLEQGPSLARLWQPNPFLLESLEVIGRCRGGQALDVACGAGRDAVYLAMAGYTVHAIDVLPDALSRANDLARRNGVQIHTRKHDLLADPSLPPGKFEVVTVFRFLQRDLFAAMRNAVAPGGHLVYETFHEQNRQTGRRPSNPDHLLRNGELSAAFAEFEILIARDSVERDGRYFSSLLARRKQ